MTLIIIFISLKIMFSFSRRIKHFPFWKREHNWGYPRNMFALHFLCNTCILSFNFHMSELNTNLCGSCVGGVELTIPWQFIVAQFYKLSNQCVMELKKSNARLWNVIRVSTLPHSHGCHMHFRTWLPCLAAIILNHPIFFYCKVVKVTTMQ
jgi:hypothetical protein